MRWFLAVAAVVVVVCLVAATWNVRHIVCDAYGWPLTRQGEEAEYIDPPWFAVEVGPGCFEVPWWAI